MARTWTFLFTDVEGSTRRWEADAEGMRAALTVHDAVLRAAVDAAGGSVFKHTGDGMCAVFDSAESVVAAAISAQRRLRDADWPTDHAPLLARMAVHTGEAQERDGDYFGPALNRVARLMGAGHGGQILTSLATAELVRGSLPDDVDLIDLGEHRLRDLERAERIAQVTAPDLPSRFPALKTLGAVRHNLPIVPTAFFGRQEDLDQLSRLLERAPLLTLIGVGGIGKTRLALELAVRNVDRFPDGVFLAELSAVPDSSSVVPAVAAAISATVGGFGDTMHDAVVRALSSQQALLMLDNCEHVIDGCAELAEDVMAASSGARIVATSREALGVAGEQLWPVGPLSSNGSDGTSSGAAAVSLFLSRAAAMRPDFHPDDAQLALIAEICDRLDGLPLAIELAAARVTHMGVAQIAERLDDRFRLLRGPGRRTDRHSTLRTTIAWSHELLDPEERQLLRRMGVFAAEVPMEAIEAVCESDDDDAGLTLDLLSSLVGKSLVVANLDADPPRYRLLETVRMFAEEQLEAHEELEPMRGRHLQWALEVIASLPGDGHGVPVSEWRRLGPLMPDIRAAIEWALASSQYEAAGELLVRAVTLDFLTSDLEVRLARTHLVLQHGDEISARLRAELYVRAVWDSISLNSADLFHVVGAATAVQDLDRHAAPYAMAWAGRALLEAMFAAGDPAREPTALEFVAHAHEAVRRARLAPASSGLVLSHLCLIYLEIRHFDEVLTVAGEALTVLDKSEYPLAVLQARISAVVAGHLSGRADAVAEAVRPYAEDFATDGSLPPQGLLAVYGAPLTAGLAIGGAHEAADAVLAATGQAARRTGFMLSGTDFLTGAGVLAAIRGDLEMCARLLGAAAASSEGQLFRFRSPASALLYVHYRDLVRSSLGPERSRELRDEGRGLDYAEALAVAADVAQPLSAGAMFD